MKTVFFGPFVGEFGWELLFWQGWVKRKCRGEFKHYYKIACSLPGRYPFYPDADEFWPLPKIFSEKVARRQLSARGYFMDNWINGWPKPTIKKEKLVQAYPILKNIIDDFKKKLPKDTEFFIPWQVFYDREDKSKYGLLIPDNPGPNDLYTNYAIPFERQALEHPKPTKEAQMEVDTRIGQADRIIAVFPRNRISRRPDKNWVKEKYEETIRILQKEIPSVRIAILGEPGGTFFENDIPDGCMDFINIDPNKRMDIHLALLNRAEIAFGSQSGGVVFALAAGCKVLCWGPVRWNRKLSWENFMNTKYYYVPTKDPTSKVISDYLKWILGSGKKPYFSLVKNKILISGHKHVPNVIRRSLIPKRFKTK
jgi:hypothetical protein